MSALHTKLRRDLWRLRYQALTIAVLIGCGIASFVSAVAASASMQASRDAFYTDARFADVFGHLKRAPRSVLDRIHDLPGVGAVDGRVVVDVRIELADSSEAVSARFVSLAWPQTEHLDQIRIREGRSVEPGSADEVVIGEAFAEAWSLEPGAAITAVINQRRARLRVVGIAVSPEFAFAANPRTGLPDAMHFGIVWMDETALAKATGSVGTFDEVAIELTAGADERETIVRVDRLLEPYGGLGAIGRADQPSAKLVEQKIAQLAQLATTLPVVFLGIAAFLLNVLLSRIVGTQREQIATLKALGYRTRELARHYLELAAAICALGAAVGTALGVAGAHGLLAVYAHYFKFPAYVFRFNAWAIAGAIAVALVAGLGGALLAVRKAVAIPPAEAMRPEAPPSYRASWLERTYRGLSPAARMIARDLQRRPMRLLLSAASIALATSIVVAGSAFGDSIQELFRLQFEVSHRERVAVTLDDARPWRAVDEVAHIPGVVAAEGERTVPVRLRAGFHTRTTAILGLAPGQDLHRPLDAERRPLALPRAGLALSRVLADELAVAAGSVIDVEVLEGDRRALRVPVSVIVDDLLGLSAYMDAAELARLLDQAPRVNLVLAAVDARDVDAVVERLKARPAVGSVSRPDLDRALLYSVVAEEMAVLSLMLAVFATAIAIGVVYNNARISLEMRARDLATLRILGFTRGELAAILLGEQAIQVVLGLAPGLVLGRAIASLWLSTLDRELVRVPLIIEPHTYVAAVCTVLFAALVSALIVRRRSDHLDLVAVLKARD